MASFCYCTSLHTMLLRYRCKETGKMTRDLEGSERKRSFMEETDVGLFLLELFRIHSFWASLSEYMPTSVV
jgi:hypothetical protein